MHRQQLNFIEIVRSEFSFLPDYGLRCIKAEPTIVRYESSTVFLNIYHGRISFEIDAEFGQIRWFRNSQSYSVFELIHLINPEDAEKYRNYSASTPEDVIAGVKRLGAILRKNADTFLKGNKSIFTKLAKQEKELSNKFATEILSRQVRPKAEEAFRRRNYAKATKLYESIESELSAAERKKLAYCRKHL